MMGKEATEVNASLWLLPSASAMGSISPRGWRGAEPQRGQSGLCARVRRDLGQEPCLRHFLGDAP